jgi:transposase
MIDMSQVRSIKTMHNNGESISSIAKALGISEPTVRKYLKQEDFNAQLPIRYSRPSKLDPYKETINEWYEHDKASWHKQRHTAQRVYDRLVSEMSYNGSYSLVQRYVKNLKEQSRQRGYLDLVWEPGEMQVDFGQADIILSGTLHRMHYLVATFPYSNVGLAQFFFGENAECVCEGLANIFTFVGGVPQRCVFDNATGIGRRVMNGVKLTELFARFELHYGFESSFCNVNSGHEKGNVENKVGTLRRNMFVPIPQITDIHEYNANLLSECMGKAQTVHYRKGERVIELFKSDIAALRPLPTKPFSCVRYERYKADKQGNVVVGGKHRYSTAPMFCGKEVILGFRAFDVDIHDEAGALIASHRRLYSGGPDESVDPAASLRLLVTRPGGWKNSLIRSSMPQSLRGHMDSAEPDMLKAYLSTIANAVADTDYNTAIEAARMVHKNTGQLKSADVAVFAARLYSGGFIVYDEPVDLAGYDIVFCGKEAMN